MEKDHKDAVGFNNTVLVSVDSSKVEDHNDDGEDFSESKVFLLPRRGGLSRNEEKVRRKVQWNDENGNKLVEVLVFEASDVSGSDEDDSDFCLCTVM